MNIDTTKPRRRITRLLSSFTLCLAVAACGNTGTNDAAPTSGAQDTTTIQNTTTAANAAINTATDTTTDTTVKSPATTAPPDQPEATTTDAAMTDAATHPVEHAFGTTDVPNDPQRIVVAGRRGTLPFLIELGFEPLGALDATFVLGQPFHPLIAEQADTIGVMPIGKTANGPNLEQVAALEPDLIIGSAGDFREVYDQLSQIAPTVGIEWDWVDPLANLQAVGDALDKSAEAAALIEDFNAEVDAVAEQISNPGTVSIIGLFGADDIRIYRQANFVGDLIARLGGSVLPTEADLAFDPEDATLNHVSLEEIGLANGDSLIVWVNASEELQATHRELAAESVVAALPGYVNDRVLEADPQFAFGTAGLAGLRALLGDLNAFLSN